MEARAGSTVEVETPFRFEVGDSIYKVSSKEAFTLSENACQRRLDSVQGDKTPCRLRLGLVDGTLRIEADVAGSRHEFSYPLGALEASRSSDMAGVLTSQFAKTGDTPFRLESLEATDFPAVLIPPALFKELRRQFYRNLGDSASHGLPRTGRRVQEPGAP